MSSSTKPQECAWIAAVDGSGVQAFAEMGALNPGQDLILGGAFAGGLLTIGPIKGSKAASLPSLLEKLIVKERLPAHV